MVVLETPEQAQSAERSKREARDHDSKDLDAQIRAANAAEKQISPAWVAACLTFAGTVLLIWNLYEARRATQLARDHMTNDLRAWLLMSKPMIKSGSRVWVDDVEFERGALFQVEFKNSGKTPAIRAGITAHAVIGAMDGERPAFPGITKQGDSLVGPDQAFVSPIQAITNPDSDAFYRGDAVVFLYAEVNYQTIFDDVKRVTRICFRIRCNGTQTDAEGRSEPHYEVRLEGAQSAN
ncbi:hypothetical protein [uncultured Brevundimonas sp.]|uniref:hypothetical protein n=1 Tax=uncultured Brevundimonas sp. TaxID=213418 RepID=UPI0025D41D68|nr:hypothetical protein [uncultured Brevundimonas sp.]